MREYYKNIEKPFKHICPILTFSMPTRSTLAAGGFQFSVALKLWLYGGAVWNFDEFKEKDTDSLNLLIGFGKLLDDGQIMTTITP